MGPCSKAYRGDGGGLAPAQVHTGETLRMGPGSKAYRGDGGGLAPALEHAGEMWRMAPTALGHTRETWRRGPRLGGMSGRRGEGRDLGAKQMLPVACF